MRPVRLTRHAVEQSAERGTNEAEIAAAVEHGSREPGKLGRVVCRLNLPYNGMWQGKTYAIKQVAPVIKEEDEEVVVVTVYTFYF